MENKVKKALDNFVDDYSLKQEEKKINKKVVLKERGGLIERIDKVYVSNDGRQLLREHY